MFVVTACAGGGDGTYLEGGRWSEADRVFHQDPDWLGGDGAYTVALDDDRTLWLFGDSFIATTPERTRRASTIVRNSIAVMTGPDPLTATMEHAWNRAGTTAFFADAGEHWFWPQGGFRVPGGPLVVFLSEVRYEPGDAFNVAIVGTRAVKVADPDGPPSTWVVEPVALPMPAFAPNALLATCVTAEAGHLVAVSVDDGHGRLVRWPLVSVGNAELATREWWTGDAWIDEAALETNPAVVFPEASTECSVGYNHRHAKFVYMHSKHSFGFGQHSDVAYRESLRLEAGYSESGEAFDPPTVVSRTNTFIYGAKAHPLIAAPERRFAATYVDSSFRYEDLVDPRLEHTLYWPHFVMLDYLEAAE